MERICLRESIFCAGCRATTMHCRVQTDHVRRGEHIHGWECETCGSVRTDDEGRIPAASARKRGLGVY